MLATLGALCLIASPPPPAFGDAGTFAPRGRCRSRTERVWSDFDSSGQTLVFSERTASSFAVTFGGWL